jgi:hypothetical protein
MLGDFVARFSTYARGLSRSLSDHGSGTSSITLRPWLGDFVARSLTYARGLPRSLSDHGSGTLSITLRPRLGDFASQLHVTGNSHTVGIFFSFGPCYKAHTSPSSKLGDSPDHSFYGFRSRSCLRFLPTRARDLFSTSWVIGKVLPWFDLSVSTCALTL